MEQATQYRYQFEKGSRKHQCPECGKKRFVRYVDATTGHYLPDQYGRCDREANCAYSLNPYEDGYSKMIWQKENSQYSGSWKPQRFQQKRTQNPTKPNIVPIKENVFKRTLRGYQQNVFLQNLLYQVAFPFKAEDVEIVTSLYYLGSVCKGYRKGAVTFPFIDRVGQVRTIQVKQFDNTNHTVGTDFLHAMIAKHYVKQKAALPQWLEAYQKQDRKVSCLFGEHLLDKHPLNPIALVEAPKTAVYGSLYFGFPNRPGNFLWLAVYNLSSLNFDKCKALHGRDVYLFPDLSKNGKAFQLWSNKAKQLEALLPGTNFVVSDLLEQNATTEERENGLDLADYLIKQDWRLFRRGEM